MSPGCGSARRPGAARFAIRAAPLGRVGVCASGSAARAAGLPRQMNVAIRPSRNPISPASAIDWRRLGAVFDELALYACASAAALRSPGPGRAPVARWRRWSGRYSAAECRSPAPPRRRGSMRRRSLECGDPRRQVVLLGERLGGLGCRACAPTCADLGARGLNELVREGIGDVDRRGASARSTR